VELALAASRPQTMMMIIIIMIMMLLSMLTLPANSHTYISRDFYGHMFRYVH